ncbi:hypothetical protein LIER_28209 [Lithospermum erythrorhizon]|uniref:non-specific serine/threonine protein kinase n=1 Tax=Lithospermum erythrorhizon TaxID=34254 RepID=A0AAV3RF89_LITER
MSSTPSSPNSSPSLAVSPSSNSSAPSPTQDSTPSPSNSTAPPPSPPPSDSPPLDSSPPPPKPDPPVSPPPSNSEPPPPSGKTPPTPPPSPAPASPPAPPGTPPTPNAPPPTDNSPPSPPNNPPLRPSPSPPSVPGAPQPSPPTVTPPLPSPPAQTVPPGSPPAPPGQSPPDPPQNNTPVPNNPTPPSGPSTPTEPPPADSTPPSPNNTSTSRNNEDGGLAAGGLMAIALVGVLLLIFVVFAVWFVWRREKKRSGLNQGHMVPSSFTPSQNRDAFSLRDQNTAVGAAHQSQYHSAPLNGSSSTKNFPYTGDPSGIGNLKSWFTYEELVAATNGFSENNLLGEGGFGCVYKGNLADGREVAVKQLKIGGGQGEREFRAEVEIISRIHHKHLVSIVGYCSSDFQRLLVYDYVPNNTLHYHLHENVEVMTWNTRFKVASGAAHGIAYLHEDCTPRIIHRDIKSANILLDNNFEAKVADFGLAKLVLELEARSHVSTRVMGTFGYVAPEYATSGKLSEKSDVFSFGVVLLELITGRKPVDSSQPIDEESLVDWARPLLTRALENGNFENLVDPRLENNYVKTEMFRLTEAAAACVRHFASKRPKMSQVVRALDSISAMSDDLTNGMKPGDSQIVDSREQSAQIRMFQRMAFGNPEHDSSFFSNSGSRWSGS